jgi:hypothetical protein
VPALRAVEADIDGQRPPNGFHIDALLGFSQSVRFLEDVRILRHVPEQRIGKPLSNPIM